MKTLIWLPTIIHQWILSRLPTRMYKPSTETIRQVEQDARNTARLAAYNLKRITGIQ